MCEDIQNDYFQLLEEIQKDETGKERDPAEVAKEIYNNRGEKELEIAISKIQTFYVGGQEQRWYDIGDFEWASSFLEQALKLSGAERAALWVKKDTSKSIGLWNKYCLERARKENRPIIEVQLDVRGARIETKREKLGENQNLDPFYFKVIEELRKSEVEQKKEPGEVAQEIYNDRGEVGLVDIISKVISYYIAGKLQKRYDIGDFEWCLDFIEESFKILGAEEAAYLVKKDQEKWIHSWFGKYWTEIAKRHNLPTVNLYGYKIENPRDKLDDDNIN